MKNNFDPTEFSDVADELRITDASLVEKDYYATALLAEIMDLEFENYSLQFSGGTCLSKAHQFTGRMSEDLDLKFMPSIHLEQGSQSETKKLFREFSDKIIGAVQSSDSFEIKSAPEKRNINRYQKYFVSYPSHFSRHRSIRPYIQVEATAVSRMESSVKKSIRSLHSQAFGHEAEIAECLCAPLERIVAEKFVALLRRISEAERHGVDVEDKAIVRHMYDLVMSSQKLEDTNLIVRYLKEAIVKDQGAYSKAHQAFIDSPINELKFGLHRLKKDPQYEEHYHHFLGPLVFHPEPLNWSEALERMEILTQQWLKHASY